MLPFAEDANNPAPSVKMGAVTRAPLPEPVALWRRLTAEFLGSGFLAAVVIGSGIAAQRLSSGETGLELLENAAATAAGLFAIILMFGPVSGAHFNPVLSFADAFFGGLHWRDAAAYPRRWRGAWPGRWPNLMFARAAVSILPGWIAAVEGVGLPHLHSFTRGIRRDQTGVTNGLTLAHSSGAAEGNVCRIKALKRQMFCRANPRPPAQADPPQHLAPLKVTIHGLCARATFSWARTARHCDG